ncbi:vacuolar protein-sorting-associated protein 36-like isoform X2 [Corticium candelabrum]|uniref:vacuolar protein-sorting-associated protein 36-like isoform X2 n=1 Tax=Corticium candelabrum TaxID=121492 RepID=UPI002E263A37|nr:vacuolar protein-sorting-associated protein 36-like isoform X2 [Corticium candelabrum]
MPSKVASSAKIIVHLDAPLSRCEQGPCVQSQFSYIRLSFKKGGQADFYSLYKQELLNKAWEIIQKPTEERAGQKETKPSGRFRAGIVGIERSMQEKKRATDKQMSQAFQDLDKLIERAKDMVTLADRFASKLEEKQGAVSEDETVAFKSYLLSIGIANPVTRETHGSGGAYHRELAKQLAQFLKNLLQESGGIMSLADVYCRFNRARGMELVSPDDVSSACKLFEHLRLPLRLKKFDSGVLVVELVSHSEDAVIGDTRQLAERNGSLTAEELARIVSISVLLAKERLLLAERKGQLCRDDSIEGLKFYPNRFTRA